MAPSVQSTENNCIEFNVYVTCMLYIPQFTVTTIVWLITFSMQSYNICAFSTQFASRILLAYSTVFDKVTFPDDASVETVYSKNLYYLH